MTEQELLLMPIDSVVELSPILGLCVEVQRVIGGWVYIYVGEGVTSIFVPEFKVTTSESDKQRINYLEVDRKKYFDRCTQLEDKLRNTEIGLAEVSSALEKEQRQCDKMRKFLQEKVKYGESLSNCENYALTISIKEIKEILKED